LKRIKSLSDLRPGDIMFAPIGGIVPGLFPVAVGQLLLGEAFRVGALSVRHVGIVVEAGETPRLVQAMPGGAEEITLLPETHWTTRHAYVRIPEEHEGQAARAAEIARMFVAARVRYSFSSYVALAAWRFGLRADRLRAWISRRREPIETSQGPVRLPREAICSVLADQAWTLAGRHVMIDTPPQVVTPGKLAARLWRLPGAIWGGASLD
jgi:hypothetical protein